MAETHLKRHREDAGGSEIETPKRHRNPHNNSPQESQETPQDLFDFFTNLSSPDPFLDFPQIPDSDADNTSINSPVNSKEESIDDDDEKERVIRHLLEASDDELGIPRIDGGGDGGDAGDSGGSVGGDGGAGDINFALGLCDGLWEIEDDAANYYTLLQSELFMQ